ncbi:MAG TPA: acylphosphatase [Acidimicrobiales bacterium]|nr:acylphosphatase [Acidimicrobiales bacterium]
MIVRRRVVITGRVQGVWFRESCRQEAVAVDVAGWVRNRGDGAVEAAFEGESRAVLAMVAWCRTGPPLAEVDGVDVVDEDPVGEVGFRVRR